MQWNTINVYNISDGNTKRRGNVKDLQTNDRIIVPLK
jgi:hypothetical protein